MKKELTLSIIDAVKTASGVFMLFSYLFATENRNAMVLIPFAVWIIAIIVKNIIK